MTESLLGRALRGGEYQIREEIARGGQATVYRAYARSLDTDVAVKVLDPTLAADFAFRNRFQAEAQSLARLHHPNLVEVHWYGEEGELLYIVMRLVPGGTLKERLNVLGGTLGLTETGRLVADVADALQHAHDHDILHLDIKPANVLLGRANWPLVADLGLTRAIERETTSAGHSRVAGTPAYMSPEQCRGAALDGRSDQYSLAVTAYELLTGQQPFQAETTEGLMQQHLEAQPRRPREVNPGLPGPIEEVLLRGLAKDPDDRFPTIREFGQALAGAVERTRGVALETKLAAAATAPNMLAVLALVLAAPFMLALLPVGDVFGRLPLAWPFQLLLSSAIAALLLGIRWQLIGLVGRGIGAAGAAFDRTARQHVVLGTAQGGHDRLRGLQHAAIASAEGVVNLAYLVATYRLVAVPALAVAARLLDPSVHRLLETGVLILLGAAALGVVVGIFRAAGPVPALVVLGFGWILATALPPATVDLAGAQSLAWTAQLVVSGGLIVLLLAYRRRAHAAIGGLVAATLGRLLIEGRPGTTPAQSAASRHQVVRLTGCVLDFGYLLLGFALLRGPIVGLLGPITTPLAGAILASGLAACAWLVLGMRLHAVAGLPGAALGLALGAPILISLPLLDAGLVHASWATVASWIAAVAVLGLLAALHGPAQALGQSAFGSRLDLGLLGTSGARTEQQSVHRVGALGRVAGALIDVAFLLVGYWIIGVPATQALVRATGQPALSSVVLGLVLVLALLLILAASRRAAAALADSGGAHWRARARALTALALAAGAVCFATFAAVPAAIAGPTVLSPDAYNPLNARVVPRVVAERDVWLPWTPRRDQATYQLVLSCSDGRGIGQFREAHQPASDAPIPAGSVGQLGITNVACDNWPQLYRARRRAAGLGDSTSKSWDWLHVKANVGPERDAEITETHHVVFTGGAHHGLSWTLNSGDELVPDSVELWEGDTRYPLTLDPGPAVQRHARLEGRQLSWFFPELFGPAERTYTLKYRLRSASEDQAVFQHLVGATDGAPIWQALIEVRLPEGTDPYSLDLQTNGLAARSGLTRDRAAWFEATDLAGGEPFSVLVKAAAEEALAPTPSSPPTTTHPPTPTPPVSTSASTSPAANPTVDPPVAADTEVDTADPGDLPSSIAEPLPEATPVTSDGTPTPGPSGEATAISAPAPIEPTVDPTPSDDLIADPIEHPAVDPTPVEPTAAPTPASTAVPSPTVAPATPTTAPTAPPAPTVLVPTSIPAVVPAPVPPPERGDERNDSGGGLIDSSPPSITYSIIPAANALGWHNRDVTVNWIVTDRESGIHTRSSGCADATLTTETAESVIICTARNSVGLETTIGVTLRLDKTRPTLEVRPSFNHPLREADSRSFTVVASEPLADALQVNAGGACVRSETVVVHETTTPGTFEGVYVVPNGAGDCAVSLTATGRDRADNPATDASATLEVDRTPPWLGLAPIAPETVAAAQPAQIVVESAEPLAGPPTVTVSGECIDSARISMSAEGTQRFTGTYAAPDGSTSCDARAAAQGTDLAGHVSELVSGGFRIDRTGPTLTLSAEPALVRAGQDVRLVIASDEQLRGLPTLAASACIDTSTITLEVLPGNRFQAAYRVPAGNTDCDVTVNVTGVDRLGNPSAASATDTFRIDRTPPGLVSLAASPRVVNAGGEVTITARLRDANSGPSSTRICHAVSNSESGPVCTTLINTETPLPRPEGNWTGTVRIPANASPGETWTAESFLATDVAGNRLSLENTDVPTGANFSVARPEVVLARLVINTPTPTPTTTVTPTATVTATLTPTTPAVIIQSPPSEPATNLAAPSGPLGSIAAETATAVSNEVTPTPLPTELTPTPTPKEEPPTPGPKDQTPTSIPRKEQESLSTPNSTVKPGG